MQAGTGNVECNRVSNADCAIGQIDSIAQRAGAGIVGIGYRVRCQRVIPCNQRIAAKRNAAFNLPERILEVPVSA